MSMSICQYILKSTIGRKQIVGLAGLGLSLFVLSHMMGNLLVFIDPQTYNEYGHALVSNKLIYAIEVGLLGLFLAHLILALILTKRNSDARPQKYQMSATGEKSTSFVTKTMWHQGIIILVFVFYHLVTFKFGTHYVIDYGSGPIRDLFRLMVEVFKNPLYVAWYVFCLLILGLHLGHGVSSTLQTLGLHHPKYLSLIKRIGHVYAVTVCLGFISTPLYIFFFWSG